ncbi:Homeodomain-like protein, partial [Cynara cardunculus var. scolymus]
RHLKGQEWAWSPLHHTDHISLWFSLPLKHTLERVVCAKMGRAPCCSKVGLHRGAWSDEEDKLLTDYIQTHGEGQWRSLPSKAEIDDGGVEKEADASKNNKKPRKKKRKTDHKSTKVKSAEKSGEEPVPDQPSNSSLSSSQSASLNWGKESSDNGIMSGASSSNCTIDEGEGDLLASDFCWPNWTPLFDMEVAGSIEGENDIPLELEVCDLLISNNDDSQLLEKLYCEYLNLLEDGDSL